MIPMEEINAGQNHCKKKQVMIIKAHGGGGGGGPSTSRKTKPNNNNNRETSEITKIINDASNRSHHHHHQHHQEAAEEELKLAGLAISFNIRLRSADMPFPMQERALRHARALLDSTPHRRPNPTLLARSLKKEFDSVYGPAWHCVVGTSFGSFVTHSPSGFVYFSVDSLSFLLFKTEVHLIAQPSPN